MPEKGAGQKEEKFLTSKEPEVTLKKEIKVGCEYRGWIGHLTDRSPVMIGNTVNIYLLTGLTGNFFWRRRKESLSLVTDKNTSSFSQDQQRFLLFEPVKVFLLFSFCCCVLSHLLKLKFSYYEHVCLKPGI